MRLRGSRLEESPFGPDRVRLVGDVEYADSSGEQYWYDFDRAYEPYIDRSGTAWLAALLPTAVRLGEPLALDLPVDPVLLRNAHELMTIWSAWYPELRPIEIEATTAPPAPAGNETAAFFSGGVDSFFTVLRRQESCPDPAVRSHGSGPIQDLLCAWGFDIPLGRPAEFDRMRKSLAEAASQLGCTLVDVATNLRETRFRRTDWAFHSHGCALASVALMLAPRYSSALLASTWPLSDLRPSGSHPLADPLLSTGSVAIQHDGAEFSRVEKTALIAQSEVALNHLRVCWKSQSDRNCGCCDKCYRTMTTLYLLGALGSCRTFDPDGFNLDLLERVHTGTEPTRALLGEVHALALQRNRPDVARAILRSFRYSDRLAWRMRVARRIAKRLRTLPVVWRLANPVTSAAKKGAIV